MYLLVDGDNGERNINKVGKARIVFQDNYFGVVSGGFSLKNSLHQTSSIAELGMKRSS